MRLDFGIVFIRVLKLLSITQALQFCSTTFRFCLLFLDIRECLQVLKSFLVILTLFLILRWGAVKVDHTSRFECQPSGPPIFLEQSEKFSAVVCHLFHYHLGRILYVEHFKRIVVVILHINDIILIVVVIKVATFSQLF